MRFCPVSRRRPPSAPPAGSAPGPGAAGSRPARTGRSPGSVPSAARSAAWRDRRRCGVDAPASACSVAAARSGVGPMLVSPIRASAIVPPSVADQRGHADDRPRLGDPVELLVRAAPAGAEHRHPDLDQHLARLRPPSPGSRRRTPRPATVRRPSGPSMTNVASSASATAGRSPAGSACASAPPKVPRCRTAGSATVPVAWASSGQCSATSGSCITSWWVVIAPITSSSPSSRTPRSSPTPPEVDQHGRVRPAAAAAAAAGSARRPAPWRPHRPGRAR